MTEEIRTELCIIVYKVFTLASFFYWYLSYVKRRENERRNEDLTARVSQRRWRQQRQQMKPTDRTPLIQESLFYHTIQRGYDSVRSLEKILRDDCLSLNQEEGAASTTATTASVPAEPECCICLEPYQVGQNICWARNNDCVHIFHQPCATVCLQGRDSCPLCHCRIILRTKLPPSPDQDAFSV